MNVGLIIYFLFNTEGLFGNFFKTVPFIDGLAAGAVIGIILQRMTRTKEEDKKEEDEELAKQKEAEALGYIDYRSFRA
jgi:xanthine/uracil permease